MYHFVEKNRPYVDTYTNNLDIYPNMYVNIKIYPNTYT